MMFEERKSPQTFPLSDRNYEEPDIRGGKAVKPKNSRQRELLFGSAGKFG